MQATDSACPSGGVVRILCGPDNGARRAMLYRVRGTNKDTNALMVIDIEANGRADAEFKAGACGMIVTAIEDITAEAADRPTSEHRGEGAPDGSTPDSGGMRNLIAFAAVLVAVVLIAYFTLPAILQKNVVQPATTRVGD